jgi:NhaP-type Na+/H+ or K+/H+ antiporter
MCQRGAMVELFLIAVAVFGYSLISGRLAMSPITAPLAFTAFGLFVGAAGLQLFELKIEGEAVTILIEATLVLVLFTDAVRIDLPTLRRESMVPTRLLGIGLPLTFAAGTGAALLLFPHFSVADAALLAAVLTPTDAALGQAVVSDRRLPARLRQGLNVESGLNDGIMVPVVTVCIGLAGREAEVAGFGDLGTFIAQEVGFGLLAGIAAGALGGWLLKTRVAAGTVEGLYRQLAPLALAIAAYAGANLLQGNGFIAAFVAGLTFGVVARDQCEGVQDFTEDEGELLAVITFTVFGAVLVGPLIDDVTWQTFAYAAASLTVVRMVPVLLATVGSGVLLESRLFLGWFGPRGLASILFGLLVLEELGTNVADEIYLVAMFTVLASVIAHGLTASPWTTRLSARIPPDDTSMPENEPVHEFPTRRRISL